MNGDLIDTLPTDSDTVEYEENKEIIENVFGKHENLLEKIGKELSHSILICILFIIFSLPQIDEMIYHNIPNSNNIFIIYGVKCMLIIILYYILRNFQIVKK